MKYLLIIAGLYCLSGCTPTPEEKAHKVIMEELRTTLHDYKSYESVKWGKLDSAFSLYADDPAYKRLTDDFDKANADAKEAGEMLKIYSGSSYFLDKRRGYLADLNSDLAKMVQDTLLEGKFQREFRSKFLGWQIQHSFRAKSLAGNLGIHHYIYYLDRAITQVIRSEDIAESAKEK